MIRLTIFGFLSTHQARSSKAASVQVSFNIDAFYLSFFMLLNTLSKTFSVGWTAKKVEGFHHTSVLIPIDEDNLPAFIHNHRDRHLIVCNTDKYVSELFFKFTYGLSPRQESAQFSRQFGRPTWRGIGLFDLFQKEPCLTLE
jgi:hypothetical protein